MGVWIPQLFLSKANWDSTDFNFNYENNEIKSTYDSSCVLFVSFAIGLKSVLNKKLNKNTPVSSFSAKSRDTTTIRHQEPLRYSISTKVIGDFCVTTLKVTPIITDNHTKLMERAI